MFRCRRRQSVATAEFRLALPVLLVHLSSPSTLCDPLSVRMSARFSAVCVCVCVCVSPSPQSAPQLFYFSRGKKKRLTEGGERPLNSVSREGRNCCSEKHSICRMSSRVKPGGGGQRERDAHARPGRCKLPADLLLSLFLIHSDSANTAVVTTSHHVSLDTHSTLHSQCHSE